MSTDAEEQPKSSRADRLIPYRFRPGQSGNPGGRPKGRSLTAILRAKLDDDTLMGRPLPEGMTVGDFLIEAMLMHAVKGDASLIKETLARVDGKVPAPEPVADTDADLSAMTEDELRAYAEKLDRGGTGPGRA